MVPHCCVPFCKKDDRRKKGHDVSYHEFPCDTDVRIKWINAIAKKDPKTNKLWLPSDCSMVCSLHFEKNCFRTSSSYVMKRHPHLKRLVKGSIPTIFPGQQIKTRSRKRRKTSEEDLDVDEPSTSSDTLNCVNQSTANDNLSESKRSPTIGTDSRSEKETNKPSQASETKNNGGSLFQPPVMIEEEIEIVSSERLPVKDTASQSVTDTKKSDNISQVSVLNSSGGILLQPPVIIKKEIVPPERLPVNDTDSQSVTDLKKSVHPPVMITEGIVSSERLPLINIGAQSITSAQVPGCFPQVLVLNSTSGSLFQPPVMIQGGIISPGQLPVMNTNSQLVTDAKESNCFSQILVLNSGGALFQLPVISNPSSGAALFQLPVIPTPSTGIDVTSTPVPCPVMVGENIASSERLPAVDTDSQSVTDAKQSDCFSQVSETSGGALFQPPVMIKKEIVSPERLPVVDTDSKSVPDAKKSDCLSQVSETNSSDGAFFQPPVLIKKEIVSPQRIPAIDTDSQSITDTKKSDCFVSRTNSRGGSLFQPPVMIKDEIVSEDEL
ncbi:uncharacterized protein [Parasteatoda tepidariorum]|uniref:uncharacterized protein isoform X2 n=1 Tax=Parasteatoda tepidariorum TaxID=114398 RepID=UPI0039BD72C5